MTPQSHIHPQYRAGDSPPVSPVTLIFDSTDGNNLSDGSMKIENEHSRANEVSLLEECITTMDLDLNLDMRFTSRNHQRWIAPLFKLCSSRGYPSALAMPSLS